jgi:hypothetical protein
VADPLDDLYALPSGHFIAARNRLAAELAAAGKRDRAREVKTLARPTVAAWAVNQLAHRHRPALDRLLAAGKKVRRVQGGGRSADDLRAATKDLREAMADLRRKAQAIVGETGGGGHLDDVLATLEAASLDANAADAVLAGHLSRPLPRPTGFGESLPAEPVTREAPRREAHGSPKPAKREAEATRRQAREVAATRKRLERDAAKHEQEATRIAGRVAKLERTRKDYGRRVDALRDELSAMERRLREVETSIADAQAEGKRETGRAAELRKTLTDRRFSG